MKKESYKIISGDIIDIFNNSKGRNILIHGANCNKKMDGGLAKQIKKELPRLYYADYFDDRTPSQKFGNYSYTKLKSNNICTHIGINLYTQYHEGDNFDLNALKNSLRAFSFSINNDSKHYKTIYLPKIGCGIGGGKWEEVEPVILQELKGFNIILVNFKL